MNFKEWERNFNACLDRPDMKASWRTLVENDCKPRILKSALYHAVDHLLVAQESAKAFGVYFQIRKNISRELSELKRELRHLSSVKVGGERLLTFFWFFYRVRKEHVAFFNKFPALLEHLENILAVPRALPTKRNWKRSSLFYASGEAALHLYVKAITRKMFTSETSVLLEGAAAAYGIQGQPSYSEEAVTKRFQRYQNERGVDYKLTLHLVKKFVSEFPKADLHAFINRGTFVLGYDAATDFLENQPEASLRLNWEKLTSRLNS